MKSRNKASQGQADHIEVATLDTRNITACAALDGVGAGLVVRLFRSEIAGDFVGGERRKADERSLDELAPLHFRQPNEGNPGDDRMSAPGKKFEHAARIVCRTGFAQDLSIDGDHGVSGNQDRRTNRAGGGQFGLGVREALHELLGRFSRINSFIDRRGEHGKGNAGITENLSPAN